MRTVTPETGAAIRRLGIPLDDRQLAADIEICHFSIKQSGNIVCQICGHNFQTNDTGICTCPQCQGPANEPGYYRKRAIGNLGQFSWRPLKVIGDLMLMPPDESNLGAIRNCFICFMYPDNTTRQDVHQVVVDIYFDKIDTINWPDSVLFWRDHVPMTLRAGLAAYRGPHDNRIVV